MGNKRQKTRSKFLTVVNTILLLLLVAVPTYAFVWKITEKDDQIKIQTGKLDGELKIVDESTLEQGILIPLTATATREDEVKELIYEIVIGFTEETKLNVNQLDITYTGEGELTLLVTKEAAGNNVKVQIKITLEIDQDNWNEDLNNKSYNIAVNYKLKTE